MRALTLLLLVIVAGCRLPFDGMCIDESRGLYLEGTLESDGAGSAATGTVSINIREARNHRTRQDRRIEDFNWSVRATGIDRPAVSAVHLHERDTNLLLVELPLENATALPDVVTQRTGGTPPNAALPWSDVYDLLGSGRGYLDVHIGGSAPLTLRANLAARNANWQHFIHSSCS